MKKIYFLFLIITTSLGAQNKTIDSLKSDLKINPKNKFWTYNELAWQFTSTSLDSLNFYNDLSKKIAKTELEKKNTELLEAVILLFSQKFEEADKKVSDLIIVFKKHKDYRSLGSAYNLQANIYNILGDFKKSEQSMYNALFYSKKTNNRKSILKSYINYGSTLMQNNKLDKGIEYLEASEKYMTKEDVYERGIVYHNLSRIFLDKKIYDKAIENGNLSIKYLKQSNASFFYINAYLTLVESYLKTKDIVKAEENIKLAYNEIKNDYDKSNILFIDAKLQMLKANFNKAKSLIEQCIEIDKIGNPSKLGEDYLVLSEIEYYSNNYQKASVFIEEALNIFKQNKEDSNLMIAYDLQLKTYLKLQGNNELHDNYIKFQQLNDTIQIENQKQAFLDLETKYRTAEKETQIKTQQLQLEKEKTNRNLALMGGGLLFVIAGGGLWYFKNKQKQVQLQTQNTLLGLQQELNHKALENLNKQLDPHEIKNLLASISPEIQDKAPEAYKKMIKLFKITKASLNNTLTEPLNKQLEQIKDFLSLEKNMLSEPLNYSIKNNTNIETLEIPRLLLKNLVENSIKHGIKGKADGGNINVEVNQDNLFINISIDDTGKGRLNAISLDSGIGTTTYQKLFATLNQKNKLPATFNIIDKTQGTKVEVKIPINYKYS